MIDRILAVWSRVETIVIGLLVLAALFTFLGGAALPVFAPHRAIDWADEVALCFIIWGTLIAVSVLVAEGRHINTEIVVALFLPLPLGMALLALKIMLLALRGRGITATDSHAGGN